jgi:hypothetical protein
MVERFGESKDQLKEIYMPYSSVDGTQHISFKKDCNDDFGTIILFSTRRLKERRLPP